MSTMTQAQVDLVSRLKEERAPDSAARVELSFLRQDYMRGEATELNAEHVIKKMLELPFRNRARYVDPGVYETATGLVRVYHGQRSGRTLAKLVLWNDDRVWFQYMGLAQKHVPGDARRLTPEEIGSAALAMNSTLCFVCGRRLDVPESVQRGIGPVCAQNYGSL